jgi:hypothetical protein
VQHGVALDVAVHGEGHGLLPHGGGTLGGGGLFDGVRAGRARDDARGLVVERGREVPVNPPHRVVGHVRLRGARLMRCDLRGGGAALPSLVEIGLDLLTTGLDASRYSGE